MLVDGNLIERRGKKIIWETKTGGNKGAFAQVTYDGRLVVILGDKILYETDTSNTPGSKLILKENGELVLFNPDGEKYFEDPDKLNKGGLNVWPTSERTNYLRSLGINSSGYDYVWDMRDGDIGVVPIPPQGPTNRIDIGDPGTNVGYIIWGYFKPPVDGNYQFGTYSDDDSGVWIGDYADQTSFVYDNNRGLVVNNGLGTAHAPDRVNGPLIYLEKNRYYPIRFVYREVSGGAIGKFYWKQESGSFSEDLSQHFYWNKDNITFGQTALHYETWSNNQGDTSIDVAKQGSDGGASRFSDDLSLIHISEPTRPY